MKLIYLVCPVAIVSVFLGLIAYYTFLPADNLTESAVDELTVTEITSEERFAVTLERIVASATWFTNFDRRYLKLDWSECANAEETDTDENNSPSDGFGCPSSDGLRCPSSDGLRCPNSDGLRCPNSVDVATDDGSESPVESNLGVQMDHPGAESNKSG